MRNYKDSIDKCQRVFNKKSLPELPSVIVSPVFFFFLWRKVSEKFVALETEPIPFVFGGVNMFLKMRKGPASIFVEPTTATILDRIK